MEDAFPRESFGLAKKYGEEIEKTFPVDKTKKHCKVIEIDEMWHHVEKKRKLWIWILGGSRGRFKLQVQHLGC